MDEKKNFDDIRKPLE